LEKCCHDIDILNWLIDSVPHRVASFGGTNIFTKENRPNEDDLDVYKSWTQAWENIDPFSSEKDIADNQVVIMEYRNNVRVTFHTNSSCGWSERKIKLCGTKGTIEGNLIDGTMKLRTIGRIYKEENIQLKSIGIHGGADSIIVNDLAESMHKGTIPKATGMEGLSSAIVCLAIDEAMVTGQVVDLEPFWKRFNL